MTLRIGFSGAVQRVREWLRTELGDGPKLLVKLEAAARAQGYNRVNMHSAARTMGIVSTRVRVEGLGWRALWSLPPENADGVRPINPPPDPSTPLPVTDDNPKTIGEQLAQLQAQQRLVDIYRRVDGELGFVDSLPGAECTMRQIKRRFGGGRYNIEGVEFTIEGSPLTPDGEQTALRPRGSTIVHPAPAAAGAGFDTAALLMTLIKQQGDILVALLTKGNPSTPDPVAMFKALDDAVTRRFAAAPPAAATPVDQALALLREGMALGQNVAEGRDPEEGGFNRTLQTVAPFLNMLAARIAPTAPAGAEPAPASPAAGVLPVPHDGTPTTALARVMVDLAPAIPDLLDNAKKGTPPDAVAAYIHDGADEAQYDALAEAADSPQFVEELMEELGRRVAPLKAGWAIPWLRQVAEKLNELLADDSRDDDETDRNDDGAAAQRPAGAGGGAPPHRKG